MSRARFLLVSVALVIFAGSAAFGFQAQAPVYDFGDLTRLADKYGTDKGSSWHKYTEVYAYFFAPMRNDARKILEIGVENGASLKMFRDYFPKATIYGIDIEDSSRLNSARIRTFVANQEDVNQLRKFIEACGSDFDLILDDGGHSMPQQQVSLGFLFPHVKPGGYYIVEDVHTSVIGGYGADQDGRNTTLRMIENFIRTGKLVSKYMANEQTQYLATHIRYCNLFKGEARESITCILKKK
jgi:predicted O-methyltransferase YrrM